LSDKAALVYDLIFQNGLMTAAELEKQSQLKKNTYHLLKELETKKLILKMQKNGRAHYQVRPPENLQALLQAQVAATKQTQEIFTDLLPDLKSHYAVSVGKPTVQYFEGVSGLQTVFNDIYAKKNTPVYGCVDLEKTEKVFPKEVTKTLIPLRIKNQLFAYSLIAKSSLAEKVRASDKEHLRVSKLIDKKLYPIPAEIDVYENKIALMSFEKGDFVSMVIENEAFATTLRSIFKLVFELTAGE
jgi:hypothetical protein